ncbi:MAG: integrase arm-type DNA-binding domain-containing protein [Azoarcus sp.]|jgi:integrase|nr:integrase arm-type DNA-binding domain-containing protein [Azoarcus sp.]
MLTDTTIRNTHNSDRPRRLADEKGLFLFVSPSGGKLWRMKYRFDGKEKLLSFGAYPDVGLKDARERRDEARRLLANGVDPGAAKKAKKDARLEQTANSFEALAREWFSTWKTNKAGSHSSKVIARLENDVFPWLGGTPVADVTAPKVLAVLRRIGSRGTTDTAHRAKQNISQVMRYAIATGRAERDPCPDLRGALSSVRHEHFAAITDPVGVGELLRAIAAFKGTHVVRAALSLAPLVFVRPAELRAARWADIELDKAEWRYFVTKTKTEHLVPLSLQAVAILREVLPLTGTGEYVFPGRDPKRPISNSTLNAALTRMGYDTKTEMTGHGFRAMARTLLAEELHQKPEVIEHQLAHAVPDTLGTAYNRTKFLKERREMMQLWADYLDKLKAGAEVIPLRA